MRCINLYSSGFSKHLHERTNRAVFFCEGICLLLLQLGHLDLNQYQILGRDEVQRAECFLRSAEPFDSEKGMAAGRSPQLTMLTPLPWLESEAISRIRPAQNR